MIFFIDMKELNLNLSYVQKCDPAFDLWFNDLLIF